MRYKIVVYRTIEEQVLQYLRKDNEVIYIKELTPENIPYFMKHIQNADALIGSGLKIDAELLENCQNLKVVSNISVGTDNLDLPLLKQKSIVATNTPHVLDESVADIVFGLLLSVARRITELDKYIRDGKWETTIGEELFGRDVHGKVVGIVGLGNIGEAVAKRAYAGFGMDVLYHNRSRNTNAEEYYNAEYTSLEELLNRSDYVVNLIPANQTTEKYFGENEFASMQTHAFFINASRGSIVDEQALYSALVSREIAGAALDVFQIEPTKASHPLFSLSNIVVTPHIGSATKETRRKMQMVAADCVLKVFAGEQPLYIIDKM